MTEEIVVEERVGGRPVARVSLNRPDKRNTITWEMRQAIADIFEKLGRDRELRAVVVTGAGGVFSSGGDMRGFLEHEPY